MSEPITRFIIELDPGVFYSGGFTSTNSIDHATRYKTAVNAHRIINRSYWASAKSRWHDMKIIEVRLVVERVPEKEGNES